MCTRLKTNGESLVYSSCPPVTVITFELVSGKCCNQQKENLTFSSFIGIFSSQTIYQIWCIAIEMVIIKT